MRLTRRQLRNLINEALGDKLKDAAGKVKSKIDQAKGVSQPTTSSSSANKSAKELGQEVVDKAPGKRALACVPFSKDRKPPYYGDMGQAKSDATSDASDKLGSGRYRVLNTFQDGKDLCVVVEKD